jgi:hypothetical protein
MRTSMKKLLSVLAWALVGAVSIAYAGPREEAQSVFDQYVKLEQGFDPAVADLYSDHALIKNKRTYPNGQVRELSLPATQYKAVLRQAMPMAKARGDTSSYSDVRFSQEKGGVRIQAVRFSHLKNYSSPISLLIGADETGKWLIREELSESRP